MNNLVRNYLISSLLWDFSFPAKVSGGIPREGHAALRLALLRNLSREIRVLASRRGCEAASGGAVPAAAAGVRVAREGLS